MKPSGIITFTTDFGLSDPYVAMMKGVVLSIHSAAVLVDISHQVPAGSISQAASLIHESFSYFPNGTVHLAVVDPGVGSTRRWIAVQAQGHLFVGPDNGIFWPVIKEDPGAKVFHIQDRRFFLTGVTHTFHGREIFAPVAAHLSLGVSVESLGPRIENPVQIERPQPYVKDGVLVGQIVRVDTFGNLITNISSKQLDCFLGAGSLRIEVGDLVLRKICRIYSDEEIGAPLALINSSGVLEVAVNLGKASEVLGLKNGEMIGILVRVLKA